MSETHTKPIRALKMRGQKYSTKEASYKKKMSGTVAAQRFQTLKQDRRQQERICWEELVRMRSAVRIRPAAPESPVFPVGKAGFFLYFSTFPADLDFWIWV